MLKKLFKLFGTSKLTKAAFVYTVSSFFNSATTFVLLPILTRYLSTKEYGIISMFNATVSFLLPFVCMGATSAIQRKIVEKDKDESVYVFNCLLVSLIAASMLAVFLLVFENPISQFTGIPTVYFWNIVLLVYSTVLVDTTLIILQMRDKTKQYALFLNTSTLLNIGISIVTVVCLNMGLTGRIYGLTFSKLAFAIIGVQIIRHEVGIKATLDKRYIREEILTYGIPLVPTSIKATVLTYTDRLFITNMVSLSETGIYSVGNQFSLPILLLAQAFNLAYIPWLYNKLEGNRLEDKRKIVKLTYAYFVIIILLTLAWTLLCIPVLGLVSGEQYENAISYVLWLSLGYAFTGMQMMVVNYIYYYKRVKVYAAITSLVIILNLVLNYFFINMLGTIGAAFATTIANFLSFILTWLLTMKICDMPWFTFRTKQ